MTLAGGRTPSAFAARAASRLGELVAGRPRAARRPSPRGLACGRPGDAYPRGGVRVGSWRLCVMPPCRPVDVSRFMWCLCSGWLRARRARCGVRSGSLVLVAGCPPGLVWGKPSACRWCGRARSEATRRPFGLPSGRSPPTRPPSPVSRGRVFSALDALGGPAPHVVRCDPVASRPRFSPLWTFRGFACVSLGPRGHHQPLRGLRLRGLFFGWVRSDSEAGGTASTVRADAPFAGARRVRRAECRLR